MARPNRVTAKPEIKSTIVVDGLERRVRPAQMKKEVEGPIGGWMKNVPEYCKHKKHDKEADWAETSLCAYHCGDNLKCPAYALLMEGAKERKKQL